MTTRNKTAGLVIFAVAGATALAALYFATRGSESDKPPVQPSPVSAGTPGAESPPATMTATANRAAAQVLDRVKRSKVQISTPPRPQEIKEQLGRGRSVESGASNETAPAEGD